MTITRGSPFKFPWLQDKFIYVTLLLFYDLFAQFSNEPWAGGAEFSFNLQSQIINATNPKFGRNPSTTKFYMKRTHGKWCKISWGCCNPPPHRFPMIQVIWLCMWFLLSISSKINTKKNLFDVTIMLYTSEGRNLFSKKFRNIQFSLVLWPKFLRMNVKNVSKKFGIEKKSSGWVAPTSLFLIQPRKKNLQGELH